MEKTKRCLLIPFPTGRLFLILFLHTRNFHLPAARRAGETGRQEGARARACWHNARRDRDRERKMRNVWRVYYYYYTTRVRIRRERTRTLLPPLPVGIDSNPLTPNPRKSLLLEIPRRKSKRRFPLLQHLQEGKELSFFSHSVPPGKERNGGERKDGRGSCGERDIDMDGDFPIRS